MKKIKSNKGQEVNVETCPKCQQELIVQMKDNGTEVFICENCKFTKHKQEENKMPRGRPRKQAIETQPAVEEAKEECCGCCESKECEE